MQTLTDKLKHDPYIGKPIPGQSLTATPGTFPYENPPQTASAEKAFLALKSGLYIPKAQIEIGQITKAGISCETLAGSIVMMAFTQGMFNPDIAEVIKPFLAVEIFKIAKNQGVKEVILENKPVVRHLDTNALESLQKEVLPSNQYDIEFTPEEQEMMSGPPDMPEVSLPTEEESQGFMSKPKEVA